MMEFVEGVKAKETLGIAQILEGSYEGKKIRMNGAVHNVRDMPRTLGTFAAPSG